VGESATDAAVREIREETGLVVEPDDLGVCAYERFTIDGEVRGRWLPGRSYLQVFRTRLHGTAPSMASTEDDVDGWRWVDRDQLERLCGAEFWWPLVPRLFD
jgi:8-oxo-dGTP pyrophosphatase MutT (NUDIX family)